MFEIIFQRDSKLIKVWPQREIYTLGLHTEKRALGHKKQKKKTGVSAKSKKISE